MTKAELTKLLEKVPDNTEIRLGSFYDDVQFAGIKTVKINHKQITCFVLKDEEED